MKKSVKIITTGILLSLTILVSCGRAQETSTVPVPTAEPTATEAPSPSPEPTATEAPTPTPTPTLSPSPEPTATEAPTPTPTSTLSPSPEPTATEAPTPTPMPSPSPEPTATEAPTPTPTPSPSPEPTATEAPTPTPSPSPTNTPTPTPSPSPTNTPTPTPSPRPTNTPTPTPDPNRNVFEVATYSGAAATSIQSLLDMNKYGGYDELIVTLPKGEYYLDRTLYVYSNTTIKVEKGAKFYKNRVYGAVIEGGILSDRGGYEGCKNITIDGGLWDAKAIMNLSEGTETFRFIHASNITIKNAEFSNLPEDSHFVVLAGSKDVLIENCSFHGYGDDGDSHREPKEAVQLDVAHSVEIVPTDQWIVWDDLPCKNVTIQNCEFYDYSRAIGSHTAVAGIYHENIVIRNNVIRDMEEVALKLYQYKDSLVSGNEISNCAGGIVVYTELGNSKKDAYFKPLNGKTVTEPKKLNLVIALL